MRLSLLLSQIIMDKLEGEGVFVLQREVRRLLKQRELAGTLRDDDFRRLREKTMQLEGLVLNLTDVVVCTCGTLKLYTVACVHCLCFCCGSCVTPSPGMHLLSPLDPQLEDPSILEMLAC